MKYIKKFEIVHENPKVGQYVLCEEEDAQKYQKVLPFINNNIGKIFKISNDIKYRYIVEYENIPDELDEFFDEGTRNMQSKEILYWSDDKSELEALLNSKKYNI